MSGGLRISCFDACALQEDDTRRFWTKPLGRYFNPRPPCGGRRPNSTYTWDNCKISIHVLRVEDDMFLDSSELNSIYFNPRPPCGGRPHLTPHGYLFYQFQSTSSVWRTTSAPPCMVPKCSYFNPRPPCGGRLSTPLYGPKVLLFQSASSVWRTTRA